MKSLPLPIHVRAYTATSAVGSGKKSLRHAALHQSHGLTPLCTTQLKHSDKLDTWIGQVKGLEIELPTPWAQWDCRNNRLAWMGLQQDNFLLDVRHAIERHGPSRVGVVIGTSTSSIGATEEAYAIRRATGTLPSHASNQHLHTLHSLSSFVATALETQGPSFTISTACSSSAKAVCAAARLLKLNLVDAVVVGGVDSLCSSILFGFNALQLLSPDPCQPFDVHRKGINLGEAAGFALLERGEGSTQLLGYGESSDAHHMSAPHPTGQGAEIALDLALKMAELEAKDIDHIHLHGTATPKNDEVEAALLQRRFTENTWASSTKGITGHTLGAAGILGTAFNLLSLEEGWIPGTANTRELDANCGPQIQLRPAYRNTRTVASHSFAFGGSNCILIWGRI